jgi:putative transposase
MGNAKFDFDEEIKNCSTLEDVTGKDGLIQKMLKSVIENMLEKEMSEYLGREKHDRSDLSTNNYRNGTSTKTLKTGFGNVKIDIPRDRNGGFKPEVIKKYETLGTGLESKIISMYSKGMSTRDIQAHVQDLYGTEISPTTISNITDKMMDEANEWFSRSLNKIYPVIFLDAVHFKVKTDGHIRNRAAYICQGIGQDGMKDILGIWVGDNEGARFWLGVCNELKNRGVEDVLIACIDGLNGFPDAIRTVFPSVTIQLCIIHQIRNTLKYVASKEQKEFVKDLKLVYRAPSEETALTELDKMSTKWGKKYSVVLDSWLNKWSDLSTYFSYPPNVRKLIYTTNPVEGFNRQLRKATKVKSIFPTDDALKKTLYLATLDIMKKWTMPIPNWGQTITQFAITFQDRLDLGLGTLKSCK